MSASALSGGRNTLRIGRGSHPQNIQGDGIDEAESYSYVIITPKKAFTRRLKNIFIINQLSENGK